MKILKKIVIGKRFTADEMNALRAGMMSDINNADYCMCSGSTNSGFGCKNNTNEEVGCSCQGNNSNTNNGIECSCGG